MSRLKALFEELGFTAVETFIASGNVIFTSQHEAPGKLEARIARHLAASLGYRVDTFVRTAEAVAAIGRTRVFPEDGREGITIHVGFLCQELPPTVGRTFATIQTETDAFKVLGREYYWLCRIRTSDSKVWSLPEIRALRLPSSTQRNMASIRKLVAGHLS